MPGRVFSRLPDTVILDRSSGVWLSVIDELYILTGEAANTRSGYGPAGVSIVEPSSYGLRRSTSRTEGGLARTCRCEAHMGSTVLAVGRYVRLIAQPRRGQ